MTTPDVEQARLGPLCAPRAIAVIGASRDPAKLGAAMSRSLTAFPGTVAGINPRDPDPPAGRYRSVADPVDRTGAPIDLAVLCVPAAAAAAALTEAAEAGVRAALVCSGGFAEAGGAGVGHQRDLLAAARRSGVALLGPNTSGFLAPARRLAVSFVPGAAAVAPGHAAVVAASGGVNHALAFLLTETGVGVSLAVGLGNAVDVTAADVLRWLAADEATRAVALHVESVPNGPALIASVRELAARKPVVALVVGRHDVADFARSHTGALATSWRTTRAALRHAGAVLVDDARAQLMRPCSGRVHAATGLAAPAGPLDEDQAKALLASLGVPTPPRRACRDRHEAHKALAELPGPVAVKVLDAGVSHKSDIGGVHLGVRDPAGLDVALDALDRIGARRYLVETMAPPGLDLIAGASRDPVFGPMVLVGLGGTIAEALADVAVAPALLTPAQAGALTGELAGRALLDGFRGGPAADRGAIGTVLAALGDLLVANPALEAAEINPLRVTGEELLALDAVVTRRGEEADHA